ncbi:MAG TPA: ATP-binding cassette domain-containing protein [Jatrophihabitans sp.]|jgi:ABC-type lipoprotein export system ATPase subunit
MTIEPVQNERAQDAIRVADLFCLYTVPGGATVAALRGLSLRVPAGEGLVVHGPNGSGKTTLLRVLTGEVAASSGSVRVSGVELAGARSARLSGLRREVLGVVDQHSGRALRPELDVLDNVALQLRLSGHDRRAARATAEESLGALGLSALAARRPPTLSAGEAQRVAVCAAMAHGPSVVLADEPTGELDIDAADAVYDLLAAAAKRADATLVLVTHDQRAARIADRVVRIRDGRLSEQWSPDAPDDEELVVDDRGWVRLPESLRRRIGLRERARVRAHGDAAMLSGDGEYLPEPDRTIQLQPPQQVTDGPVAALRDIGVSYGDRVVFDGFDATIAPGALTIVRGRSGAGKSTLLRLLLGLADPDSGTVRLGEHDLAVLSRSARADVRRALVGVSMQSGALAEPLDTWENLALARAARGMSPDDAPARSVVAALGLAAVSRRPVRLLSGGERQRVGIARSLVTQRPLVVLDEPTSQQDEAHAEIVAAVLVAAARAGVAVVAATHDPVLAAAADTMIALA